MIMKVVLVFVAYLLGSIPFGYLFTKYVFTEGEDVRTVGSGGTGATNVWRRAGMKAGLITFVLDVAKGVAAVMLMRLATDDYFFIAAAAIAAIVGHILPIFLAAAQLPTVPILATTFVIVGLAVILHHLVIKGGNFLEGGFTQRRQCNLRSAIYRAILNTPNLGPRIKGQVLNLSGLRVEIGWRGPCSRRRHGRLGRVRNRDQ